MNQNVRRKILAGGRLRKLRSGLGLSQSAMALELGISASYLNLIERNERPVTAQLLIRLAETYNIDAAQFAAEDDLRTLRDLEQIFADPVFHSSQIDPAEIRVFAEAAPTLSEATRLLYSAYAEMREFAARGGAPGAERDRDGVPPASDDGPVERARLFLEQSNNYFEALERRAEALVDDMGADGNTMLERLAERLRHAHGIHVQIAPVHAMSRVLRHYDRHRRRLMLSELLDRSSRQFQAAVHLALVEAEEEIAEICAGLGPPGSEAFKLGRVMLCNYFAAAVIMPYRRFAEAAEALAYDIDVLGARFSASFEQVAHRLTTLSNPKQKKVPFFMIRVDKAGNVSKRFSSGAFPFSRFGGTCARWNIHNAFCNPGAIERQVIELPDGGRWFSIARTVQARAVPWGEPEARFVVALGCDIKHASKLVYGRSLDLRTVGPTPVGINCRLCDRPDCAQRAAPPFMRRLALVETTRGLSPFGH
jgi:hypothetical protein